MAGVPAKEPVSLKGAGGSVTGNPKDIALQVQWGPIAGKRFRVAVGKSVKVGRSVVCDIPFVHDAYISRTHFSLDWEGSACWIHDLNSRHGTFLNGQKVERAALSEGDTIRAGWTTIVVQSQTPSADECWRNPVRRNSSPRQDSTHRRAGHGRGRKTRLPCRQGHFAASQYLASSYSISPFVGVDVTLFVCVVTLRTVQPKKGKSAVCPAKSFEVFLWGLAQGKRSI